MTDLAQGIEAAHFRSCLEEIVSKIPENRRAGAIRPNGGLADQDIVSFNLGFMGGVAQGALNRLPPSKAEDQAKALLELLGVMKEHFWDADDKPDSDSPQKVRNAYEACKEAGL